MAGQSTHAQQFQLLPDATSARLVNDDWEPMLRGRFATMAHRVGVRHVRPL